MSKEPYPSETADRFIVRFPDGMRDRIKDAAATNNRSMNAEIIARLENSFAAAESLSNAQAERIVEITIKRVLEDIASMAGADMDGPKLSELAEMIKKGKE